MSPNIWMFVRTLELDKQRTPLDTRPRRLDPIADAMAQRYPPAPVA